MNSPTNKPILPALETVCCSRCAGSGHYSRCESYGTRCFKCAGAGTALTKRAAIARAYITSLRTKLTAVADIKAGERVNIEGKWATALSVEVADTTTTIKTDCKVGFFATDCCAYGNSTTFLVLVPYDKDATWAAGLALQNSLSKMGKPTKATSPEHLAWIAGRKSA